MKARGGGGVNLKLPRRQPAEAGKPPRAEEAAAKLCGERAKALPPRCGLGGPSSFGSSFLGKNQEREALACPLFFPKKEYLSWGAARPPLTGAAVSKREGDPLFLKD